MFSWNNDNTKPTKNVLNDHIYVIIRPSQGTVNEGAVS